MRVLRSLLAILLFAQAAEGFCGRNVELTPIGTLPVPLMMHGSAYAGGRLYIIGGNVSGVGWTERVWSARVTEQGQLEEWRSETSLPAKRAYLSNSVSVLNGRLYVFGGSIYPEADSADADGRYATDYLSAPIGKNGILGPWRRTPAQPGLAVTCSASCSTGTLALVLAGSTAAGFSDAVEVAKSQGDGKQLVWNTAPSLPKPLWFHGAGIDGEYVYAWGGLASGENTDVNQSCWRAPVSSDGTIGSWEEFLINSSPTYSAACGAVSGLLVSFGGRFSGGMPTNQLEIFDLRDQPGAGWQPQSTELQARIYTSLAAAPERNCFYLTGGMDKRVPGFPIGVLFPTVDEVVMGIVKD